MKHEVMSYEEVRRLAAELYEKRHRSLMAIAREATTEEADAEDALQETFLSFIDHFEPGGEVRPMTWVIEELRRRCREGRIGGDGTGAAREEATWWIDDLSSGSRPIPERLAEREEARSRLARLGPDQRSVLVLGAAGFSRAEIARFRGWSFAKVGRCIEEGLARLRGMGA